MSEVRAADKTEAQVAAALPDARQRRPRRRRQRSRLKSHARAASRTGCCATTSVWLSRPTKPAASISSASTLVAKWPSTSASWRGPWAYGPTRNALLCRRYSSSGGSRTCFLAQTVPGNPDRHYVPRVAHTTGDLDIHDIGVMADGRIVFVNSLFSCLATLSPTHAFRLYWKPPFISKLAAEDRCHLNGLAMKDGVPAYVTATSRSDVVNGWRARRGEGGTLIDVRTDAIVSDKLSMPHSPRWYNGRLWLLNSGTGYLGSIDPDTGVFEPLAFCPGFLRGLAFHNGHAIVGLSLPRDGSFSGLALDSELKKRDADPWCGVQIVNLASGDIVEWIKLEGGVSELFDVAVLPGVRWPVATGFLNDEIHSLFTFEL